MTDLRALIFDVDGTLAETEEAHRAAFNRAFAEWKLDWEWSVDDYRILLKTTGGKERIRAFLQWDQSGEMVFSDGDIAGLHALKTKYYVEILRAGELQLRPGVRGLIEAAREAGLRLAVATTTSRPNVEALSMCCWGKPADQVFEVIAAGDEVAVKKPAPDVFLLALQRLGLPPGACLAFEDSRNGVLSAHHSQLSMVVTPSMYTDGDDFSEAQDVVPSLRMQDLPETLRRRLRSG